MSMPQLVISRPSRSCCASHFDSAVLRSWFSLRALASAIALAAALAVLPAVWGRGICTTQSIGSRRRRLRYHVANGPNDPVRPFNACRPYQVGCGGRAAVSH